MRGVGALSLKILKERFLKRFLLLLLARELRTFITVTSLSTENEALNVTGPRHFKAAREQAGWRTDKRVSLPGFAAGPTMSKADLRTVYKWLDKLWTHASIAGSRQTRVNLSTHANL